MKITNGQEDIVAVRREGFNNFNIIRTVLYSSIGLPKWMQSTEKLLFG